MRPLCSTYPVTGRTLVAANADIYMLYVSTANTFCLRTYCRFSDTWRSHVNFPGEPYVSSPAIHHPFYNTPTLYHHCLLRTSRLCLALTFSPTSSAYTTFPSRRGAHSFRTNHLTIYHTLAYPPLHSLYKHVLSAQFFLASFPRD